MDDRIDLDGAVWRKSSHSGEGNCVEVAALADGSVGVRDTKAREAGVLRFSGAAWSDFLAGVRSGEFG